MAANATGSVADSVRGQRQLVRSGGSASDNNAESSTPKGEEEPMTTHRSLTALAFLAMAGAALIRSAGVANASPQDDAYLAALQGVGLSWTPGTQARLIQEAHDVCYNLTWGWSAQQIANDLEARLGGEGVTEAEAATMVNAAHRIYCPGNVCDAPSLCT
jgi:hypothetical protein